ncbi:fatty acid desaturase [Nitratireductor sp. OM-1]|uniref:fatty acid desaturase n=1 Tax=Nitratireductor sp. OM-1 TaxID=1756988 RepID=UPI000DDF4EC9|nr:fatty acid desaturase [Nitratireductor sp. OM-1]
MKGTNAGCTAVKPEGGSWTAVLAQYRKPNTIRSTVEIAATAVPFVALWTLTAVAVANGYWLGLLLTVPAAGFLVRLFILQHDCGHGALFARRGINDWTGRVIGVFTLTPYDYWRRTHAVHHATAGNLDKRGIGDVSTLTVSEFRALSRWGRIGYRLYRHPAVMFGIGPAWLFVCQYRLPVGLMWAGYKPWVSTVATNIGAAVPVVGLMWLLGIGPFLMVQVPITLIAATVGVWLFFIQHQFEQTHWSDNKDWKFQDAALYGSSHYDLPFPLRWITGNIGIHHVHHMAAKVPFYRLPEVLRDYPDLRHIGRITLFQSFSCVKLVLWDEQAKRLVSFREALQN